MVDSAKLAKLLKLLHKAESAIVARSAFVATSKASSVMVSEPIGMKIGMKHLVDIMNQF